MDQNTLCVYIPMTATIEAVTQNLVGSLQFACIKPQVTCLTRYKPRMLAQLIEISPIITPMQQKILCTKEHSKPISVIQALYIIHPECAAATSRVYGNQ